MADLKVEVVRIENIAKHPDAGRLDLATVFGYTVVVGRDEYAVDDYAVYFPVDSILPSDLEDFIFQNSKVKLSKHRVRAAKIRGVVSVGLLVSIQNIKKYMQKDDDWKQKKFTIPICADMTHVLGVTKHDPELHKPAILRVNRASRKESNPFFHRYTKIRHFQKNHKAFDTWKHQVFVTEKIHGTNFRAGWVPTLANSWFDRLRIKLGKSKFAVVRMMGKFGWTFVFGSHNVQIKSGNPRPAHGNVYAECVEQLDLKSKIPFGQIWYGEIFGPGIQKGHAYGLEPGHFSCRFFDVKNSLTGEYKDFPAVVSLITTGGCQVVPYKMMFFDKDVIDKNMNHPPRKSALDGKTEIEGVVIRPYFEETYDGDRKIFKWISNSTLLKKGQTEYK